MSEPTERKRRHFSDDQKATVVRRHLADKVPAKRLLGWMELSTSKFHPWKDRYGKANEHNGKVPRDWWLADWEKHAILDYHERHPLEGYRSLTFMMLDDDVLATSPSSVYRVLKQAGRLDRNWRKPRTQAQAYVDHYNHVRLHSAIDYLTPTDKLNGLGPMNLEQRDQKLEQARAKRQRNRAAAKAVA
jgi:hypothetical protein